MPRLLASAWRQNRISGRCWRAKYCRPSIGSVKRYSARSALPGRTLFYHANRPFESDPGKITLACGSHQPCRPATIGIFNTADWCVSNYLGNLRCSRATRVSRKRGVGGTVSKPSSPGWSPGALPWLCYSRVQGLNFRCERRRTTLCHGSLGCQGQRDRVRGASSNL